MLFLAFIFFGLIIGSFSNALIYRLPRRISLTNPKRSCCPTCNHEIKFYDNIPVLSWLFLRGKCRNCKTNVPLLYPLIEIANGASAYLSLLHFEDIPTALLAYLLISILITISVIDLEHMIIPDKINKPGMIIGLLLGLINGYLHIFNYPFSRNILESALGLVVGYGLLYLIAWAYFKATGQSGLGGGDIKLMGFMGALLGPLAILPILIASSFVGVLIGMTSMMIKNLSVKSEIPFGPSLAIGIILYVFGFDVVESINSMNAKFILPLLFNG